MSRETLVRARVERGGFALDVELKTEARVAVLFGPSGSGKTTLFETLLGLHAASRPASCTVGREAACNPSKVSKSVVLPEPDGPKRTATRASVFSSTSS